MRLYTLLKQYLTTVKPVKYGGTGQSNLSDFINKEIKPELIDLFYPIGSIYTSTSATSPESLFGGSWEKLENRFLLGAGEVYSIIGETGGETAHTLTTDELPSHTHTFTGGSSTLVSGGAHTHNLVMRYTETSIGTGLESLSTFSSYRTRSGSVWSAGAHTHTVTAAGTNTNTGGDLAHNNMPPYLVVYMWKRIG